MITHKMLRRSRLCVQRPSMWARWCQSGWRIKEEGVWEPRGTPVLLESTTQVGLERLFTSSFTSSSISLTAVQVFCLFFFQTFPSFFFRHLLTTSINAQRETISVLQREQEQQHRCSAPSPAPFSQRDPGTRQGAGDLPLTLKQRRNETGTHGLTGEWGCYRHWPGLCDSHRWTWHR